MRQTVLFILLACCWCFVEAARAQMCKWVDENGVTHYATECPQGVEGKVLELDTEPSKTEAREARQRARQVQDELRDRRAGEVLEAEEKAARERAADAQAAERRDICIHALMNLATLELTVPVYYDETGELHHDRSRRSRAYEGQRTYLDDADREAETRRYQREAADYCEQSKAEQEKIARMIREKSIDEVRQEICAAKRYELERIWSGLTGIPPPAVRELQKYIEENCDQ